MAVVVGVELALPPVSDRDVETRLSTDSKHFEK